MSTLRVKTEGLAFDVFFEPRTDVMFSEFIAVKLDGMNVSDGYPFLGFGLVERVSNTFLELFILVDLSVFFVGGDVHVV